MKETGQEAEGRHDRLPGGAQQRMMLVNPDRVFYLGLLGVPSRRCFGAFTLYVARSRPFHLCLDDHHWESQELAVIPPYVAHRIMSDDALIGSIMIEPESVDLEDLPAALTPNASGDLTLLARIREAYAYLQTVNEQTAQALDADRLFLGQRLARRTLDPRVATIVDAIKGDPTGRYSASVCAEQAGLSFSRFLHLFKDEVGVSFRKFQAWKRARSLLYHVNRRQTLTSIALDVGYPDATHFSHSIRQVYGLAPKTIFAGSRRLLILHQPGISVAASHLPAMG